jgi:4-carboxymuconolactone decarboxylase
MGQPGTTYDIAAREAQVVGERPRIDPLDESELSPEAQQAAMELRAAFRIPEDGRISESFLMMLHHPELFRAQTTIGIALAGGVIPARERELAVLRNAWICGAPLEWGEHVAIGRKRCGMTAEEVERCTKGSQADGWTDHERAIMKAVEELHADYAIADDTWAELAKTWSNKQLAEFPVLVGSYTMTAMMQNSLRYRLEGENTGLAER